MESIAQRICSWAAEMFGVAPEEVLFKKGRFEVKGESSRSLSFSQIAQAAKQQAIEVESFFGATETPAEGVFAACVAEVYVDVETGQIYVRKLNTAHDVATILNPISHQGQIDGGIVQGLGYVLMEELMVEDGRVTTLNFGEYKIPNVKDIVSLETTLVHGGMGPAPFHSKEIGESAISQVAPAIANAVYDAVGVRIKDLPITAEKVFAALRGRSGKELKTEGKESARRLTAAVSAPG